ncbi:hypothetical protein [Microlunatus soli]|uniref:Nucleotidyltransferase domain-containing protein n=1 Tax=Microlunatus soli TaxID=630515 RepID=A0A1H1PNG5_9ACTN|nr:hypothetical protein [Microlunatus soli]SDS12693.1 hypothetical protein SAMN04489812_0963 [Microlunatus soli]
MAQRNELSVPDRAVPVVTQLADHYRRRPELGWMYGQGSVFSGLRDDSDLDLILVWEQMPTTATLPHQLTSRWIPHGNMSLEKATIDACDVDLMHVPRPEFENWLEQVRRGDGWTGHAWPQPIHVAAGRAEAVMLLDDRGDGAAHQLQVQRPSSALVEAVTDQLRSSLPGYVRELREAAAQRHRWLYTSLASQLHRTIYLAWFLAEGHYPPFPKYLPQWFDRLNMNTTLRRLEDDYWSAPSDPDRADAIAELAEAVVTLAEQKLIQAPSPFSGRPAS